LLHNNIHETSVLVVCDSRVTLPLDIHSSRAEYVSHALVGSRIARDIDSEPTERHSQKRQLLGMLNIAVFICHLLHSAVDESRAGKRH